MMLRNVMTRAGLAILAVAVVAAPVGAQITEGVTVEGITQYTLDNGLEVLLFPDQSKQTTTVNVTYFVGSRHESYGETGMAHLLEHLVFKGTPDHPDIPQELTEHGARPNGTTWFDRTNYFETFEATDENLSWAIDLEADRMVNSFISAVDLESEMTVVRNEFELGENNPFRVTMQRTMSTAFVWHNYGKSTIGARADLENVPIERLQEFYRKYYQPDNAMLVVAGKFDQATVLELIVEKFGAIPRPDRTGYMKIWDTYTLDPTQDGERSVTVRRVGDTQLAMALYKVPAGSDPAFAAVDVAAEVFSAEPSGRLYQALVKPGLAARVGVFGFQLREPGVLLAFAEVRMEGDLDLATVAMIETFETVADQPMTEEEVERAKTKLLKNIELGFNASDRIGMQLSEWSSMGDWRLIFLHRDRIRDVTVEDVQALATAYFKPANRTIGRFIPSREPDRAEIPELLDVAVMMAGYEGMADVAEGEAFDPSVANIESRTTRTAFDNGFQVALLPKKTRGESVVARGRIHFGGESALMNKATAAQYAGGMLMRGTATKTRQEVEDEFDRLKAQVRVNGSVSSATFSVETTRENLADVLRLMGEVLHEPAFDEAEFTELKEERLAGLERQKSEPIQQGFRAFSRHLTPYPKGHPSYIPTFEEEVVNLSTASVAEAKTFYTDFYGVGTGEVAVVGDFDPEEILPVLEGIFAQWESPQVYQRIAHPYQPVEPTNLTLETPDKASAVFLIGNTMPISDTDDDYPAMVLGDYMLGGGFLNSRLATRIRREDGLSYAVGSQFSAMSQDENGTFLGYAMYAPENVEALEVAFLEEIDKVLADGFTDEEIEAAKAGYLDGRKVSRAQDRELAGGLSGALYDGRTLEYDAEVEAAIAGLTAEDIVTAMRRRLDPSAMSIIKAGDFAKNQEEMEVTP
ncbi:MAG: pitrilysin family protein [Gemmatimonadales bacterium]